MRGKNQIPDFSNKKEWEFSDRADFTAHEVKSDKMVAVGIYELYYNERTQKLGFAIRTLDAKLICLLWETEVTYKERLSFLNYIAYFQKGTWVIRRLKDPFVSAKIKKKEKGIELEVEYSIITGKRESFFITS